MQKFLRKVAEWTLDEVPYKTVELQKVGFALKQAEVCAKRKYSVLPPEQLPQLQESIEMLSDESLQLYVQGEITRQLIPMYHAVQEAHKNAMKVQNELNQTKHGETESKIDFSTPINILTNQRHKMSFVLEVKPSVIPGAGQGVFVKLLSSPVPNSSAPAVLSAGTVVALYPGLVHLKEHLSDKSYVKTLLPDPDFMLQTRLDQMIIDARHFPIPQIPMPSMHPYALAHKINHGVYLPSREEIASHSTDSIQAKIHPNVTQVTYNYPHSTSHRKENFPEDLRPWIPNRYARPPSEKSMEVNGFEDTCMHGLVMVLTEPVQDGQELFMDYRLHPNAGTAGLWPSWYKPHDVEQSENRWLDRTKYI